MMGDKPRILMVFRYLPSDKEAGGGDIVAWNTMKELSERGYGIEAVLTGESDEAKIPEIKNVSFHIAPKCRRTRPLDIKTALRWLKKSLDIKGVDLIHTFSPEAVLVNLKNRLRGKPVYHETHFPQLEPYTLSEIFETKNKKFGALLWALHLRVDRMACVASRRIITPSHYSRRNISRTYGIDEGRIVAAYDGVDLEVFKDFGLERKERIVSVGRLYPQKGFDILLKAFKEVQKNKPEVGLDIVGEGPLRRELGDMCLREGIKNVVFYDHLSQPRLCEILNKASVFALPSRSESFGMAAAEAMACGLPVVASNVGGLPEVVEDQKTGYLIAPENPRELAGKLEVLLDDKSLRSRFGSSGLSRVREKFTWGRRVDVITKEVYSTSLSRS